MQPEYHVQKDTFHLENAILNVGKIKTMADQTLEIYVKDQNTRIWGHNSSSIVAFEREVQNFTAKGRSDVVSPPTPWDFDYRIDPPLSPFKI